MAKLIKYFLAFILAFIAVVLIQSDVSCMKTTGKKKDRKHLLCHGLYIIKEES